MKLHTTFAALVLATLCFGTGCGTAMQGAGAPPSWERRTIANGVELHVSSDASPEAQKIAQEIQQEMRARYISAR